MANSIDKRIVEMQFDNSRFERNVSQSISTLDRLKKSLDFTKDTKSIETLERTANNIDFSGLERSIANIEHRFSAFGIAGATIISNLTTKAMGAVSKINSAIFGQMKSGGINRALNLEHANFMLQGLLKDAEKVQEIMGEGGPVQNAVKGTAYGLDAAANAAAQFVASGVKDADKLESALTAISGAAAMTGSSYEDISRIFTTVAGNGRLMADQLNQFSARGLNAAAALAEQLGKTEGEIRQMVSKGQIDFMTFATVMNNAFGEQAKKANDTFTGALSNVKAALSRIGAKVAQPTIENLRKIFVSLIGVIDQTSKTIQPLIDLINTLFDQVRRKAENFLYETKKIQDVVNNVVGILLIALDNILRFLKPIAQAFRDIFPKSTIDDAIKLTGNFANLLAQLRISDEAADKLRRTFRGLFSIFDILGQAVSAFLKVFFPSIDTMSKFGDKVLDVSASFGDFIYALSQGMKANNTMEKFFTSVKDKLINIKDVLKSVITKFQEFTGIKLSLPNTGKLGESIKNLVKNGEPLKKFGDILHSVFEKLKAAGEKVLPVVAALFERFKGAMGSLGKALTDVFAGNGFDTLIALINGGVLAGLGIELSNFLAKFSEVLKLTEKTAKGTNPLTAKLTKTLNTFKDTLTEFQGAIKVYSLLTIAKAIAILTASLLVLSMIKPEKLLTSIGVMTVLLKELEVVCNSLAKIARGGLRDVAGLAGILIGVSASVLILSFALAKLSTIDSNGLVKGIGAVTVLLAEMTGVAILLGKFGGSIKTGAVSIIAFAIAVNIVASSLEKIGAIPIDQLKQGLKGLTVIMLELAVAAAAMGVSGFGVSQGAGILLVAAALKILTGVIMQFASVADPNTINNALLQLGIILGELVATFLVLGNFTENVLKSAAAIAIVSVSLTLLSGALKIISTIGNVEDTLIMLGGALFGITASLILLGKNAAGVLAGAAAMLVVAGALGVIGAVMATFAAISASGQMFNSLLMLALGVAALAVPLAILAPLGPALLIVGGAFALMGVGIAGLGVGLLAVATGLSIIAGVGTAAASALILVAESVIMMIPKFGKAAADMILAFAVALGEGSVLIVEAVIKIVEDLLVAIISVAPLLGQAVIAIGSAILSILNSLVPQFVETVINIFDQMLQSINNHIPSFVESGCGIIEGLMQGFGEKVPELIDQAFQLAIDLINGLADGMINNEAALYEALDNLLMAILITMADWGTRLFEKGVDILNMLIKGLLNGLADLSKACADLLAAALVALGVDEDFVEAAKNWVYGLIDGINEGIQWVVDAVTDLAHKAADAFCEFFGIESPSTLMADNGKHIDEGLANGIRDNSDNPVNALEELGNKMNAKADEKGTQAANAYANAFNSILNTLGINPERQKMADAEDAKRNSMYGYNNIEALTKAGQAGLLQNKWAHKAKAATDAETKSLGGNTGATKKNSKAKKENAKENEKKTKEIDEETEALGEETEAAESNEEEIRALAEEIEVVTKAYDKLLDTRKYSDTFKIVKRQQKILGQFWSAFGKEGWTTTKQVNKAFKAINQTLLTTSKTVKKGTYAFNNADKYLKKYKDSTLKNETAIKKAVMETGKTIAKVYDGRAKVYSKTGSGVEKMTIRLTKSIKNLAKYAKEAKNFANAMGNVYIYGEKMGKVEDFVYPLRNIQKYFVNLGSMPGNVKKYLQDIRAQFYDFHESMRLLNKAISGDMSIFSGKNEALPYVEDAFISLASTLYDGSEAANEYATEHARLLFLMENGLATAEEVEEHYVSYIQRITDALKEYYNTLQETLQGSLDIWSEFDRKTDDQTKDFLSTIDSQLAGYQQWGEMLMEVSKRGIDFDLLKQLTDSGVQSFGKLKNLLIMTENEFAYFNLRYMESQQAAKMAADMALAALANARTMATARAASASGKLTQAQLKQSKAAAKSLADNNKAVARYQARYNNMTKRQENEYLKSLTKEQKAEYKKAKKEEEKRVKTLKAKAATEEAKRSEENRIKTILEGIKTFEDYSKVLGQYANDTKTITALSEFCTKAFKGLEDVVSDNTEGILNFADVLDESGEEGLNYFEEMAKRIQKLKDEIVDSVKSVNLLTTAFSSAEKMSTEKIMSNMLSQIYGNTQSTKLFQQLANKGYTSYVIKDVIEQWKSDHAAGNALIEELLKGDQEYIDSINAGYEKMYGEDIAKAALNAAAKSNKTLSDYKQASEAAQKAYNDAVAAENAAKSAIDNTAYAKEQKQKEIDDKRLGELKNILKKKGKLSKAQEKEYIKLLKKYGGKYKGTVYATLNDAISEKIKLDAYNKAVADYNKAVSTRIEKLHELEQAQQEQANEEARVNDLITNNEKKAEVRAWFNNIISSVENVKKALKSMGASTSEEELLTAKVKSLVSEFKDADLIFRDSDNFKAIKEYADKSEPFGIMADGLYQFGVSITDANTDAQEFFETLKQGLKDYEDQLNSSIKSSSDFFSMFKGFSDEDNPLQATDYLEYAESQKNALIEWQNLLKTVTDKGLDKELVEKFASQGLGSYEQLSAWAKASAAQIGEYNQLWRDYQTQVENATNTAMASIAASWSDAGQVLSESMIEYFNNAGADRLKEAGYQASAMVITGVKDGLTNAMPTIISAVEHTDTSGMSSAIGKSIGTSINTGLVEAISGSVNETVSTAVEKFKMAVDSVLAYANEVLPTDYTITIHVDTSEIDAAVARMNAAIAATNVSAGQTSAAVTSSATNQNATTEPISTEVTPNAVNLNYVQNNYSPKALDQVEIYRNTQNQLNSTRDLIELQARQ